MNLYAFCQVREFVTSKIFAAELMEAIDESLLQKTLRSGTIGQGIAVLDVVQLDDLLDEQVKHLLLLTLYHIVNHSSKREVCAYPLDYCATL